MKRNNKKIFRSLILSFSLATYGCGNSIVEGGLKSNIITFVVASVLGAAAASTVPYLVESEVFSTIDKTLDEQLTGGVIVFKAGLKQAFKTYYQGRARKNGIFRAIRELETRADELKKLGQLEGNNLIQASRLTAMMQKLNNPDKTYKHYVNLDPLPPNAWIEFPPPGFDDYV